MNYILGNHALANRDETIEAKGCGGVFRDGVAPMTYQLTLPKDHPDGPKPVIAQGFTHMRELLANEAKVLIILDAETISGKKMMMFDWALKGQGFERMLGEDSYIVHTSQQSKKGPRNSNKSDIAAWVRSLQCPIKKNDKMEETSTKKYLICDWLTAAGFEAPAVIIFTTLRYQKNDPRYAAYCLRAKAKLVLFDW